MEFEKDTASHPVCTPHASDLELSLESQVSRLSIEGDGKSFYRRVSFDNVASSMHSYTLRTASKDYHPTERSRLFMIAAAADKLDHIIDYTVSSLLDDGDEVILVSIQPHHHTPRHETPKEQASQMMKGIIASHQNDKQIKITVELVFGRLEPSLQAMVRLYQPTMLIVGSCSKYTFSTRASIFRYSMKHSPVPVAVVNCHKNQEPVPTTCPRSAPLTRILRSFTSMPHFVRLWRRHRPHHAPDKA